MSPVQIFPPNLSLFHNSCKYFDSDEKKGRGILTFVHQLFFCTHFMLHATNPGSVRVHYIYAFLSFTYCFEGECIYCVPPTFPTTPILCSLQLCSPLKPVPTASWGAQIHIHPGCISLPSQPYLHWTE